MSIGNTYLQEMYLTIRGIRRLSSNICSIIATVRMQRHCNGWRKILLQKSCPVAHKNCWNILHACKQARHCNWYSTPITNARWVSLSGQTRAALSTILFAQRVVLAGAGWSLRNLLYHVSLSEVLLYTAHPVSRKIAKVWRCTNKRNFTREDPRSSPLRLAAGHGAP